MKHPFLLALGAGLLVIVAALGAVGWQMLKGPAPGGEASHGLPWQVAQPAPGRTQVFDMAPGRTTLAELRRRFGADMLVAVVARREETGSLEAMVDPYRASYVTGRLVLAFDAPADALARWRGNAASSEAMEGNVRRFALKADDLAQAEAAVLTGISFLPAARLDEAVLRQRFGAPAETIALGAQAQAWLYPALGLAVTLDARGRDVLNYVAPADFEARLRAPLKATAASGPAG